MIYLALVNYMEYGFEGIWAFDSGDLVHWVGIFGLALFIAAFGTSLDQLKQRLAGNWVRVHCGLGLVASILALAHSRTRAAVILPLHYGSYYIAALMALISVTGAVLRFRPDTRYRSVFKILHGPATSALKLALLHHVLVKMAVI